TLPEIAITKGTRLAGLRRNPSCSRRRLSAACTRRCRKPHSGRYTSATSSGDRCPYKPRRTLRSRSVRDSAVSERNLAHSSRRKHWNHLHVIMANSAHHIVTTHLYGLILFEHPNSASKDLPMKLHIALTILAI